MSGLKSSLAAIGLLALIGSAARGQGVPGGWSPRFGYQDFGVVAPRWPGGAAYNPYGFNPYVAAGVPAFGSGLAPVAGPAARPPAMAIDATGSLIDAIGRSTARSSAPHRRRRH